MVIDEPSSAAIKQGNIAVDKVALETKRSRWHTKGKKSLYILYSYLTRYMF